MLPPLIGQFAVRKIVGDSIALFTSEFSHEKASNNIKFRSRSRKKCCTKSLFTEIRN